jgi:hypothetical protein
MSTKLRKEEFHESYTSLRQIYRSKLVVETIFLQDSIDVTALGNGNFNDSAALDASLAPALVGASVGAALCIGRTDTSAMAAGERVYVGCRHAPVPTFVAKALHAHRLPANPKLHIFARYQIDDHT